MREPATHLVSTVEIAEGVIVGACWDGGPTIGVHVQAAGRTARAASWAVWNEAWDSPLIAVTRESFERFIVGRLQEPGVIEALAELAGA